MPQVSIRKVSCLWTCSALSVQIDFLRNKAQKWSEYIQWKEIFILNCLLFNIKIVHPKQFSFNKFSPKARKVIYGNPEWTLGQIHHCHRIRIFWFCSYRAVKFTGATGWLARNAETQLQLGCSSLPCSWALGTFVNTLWSHSCLVIETPWRTTGVWSSEVPRQLLWHQVSEVLNSIALKTDSLLTQLLIFKHATP